MCNGADGGLGIVFQFIADRIEFEAERNRFRGASRKSTWQHCRKSEKRTSRKSVWRHNRMVLKNERDFIPFCRHASYSCMLSARIKARQPERMPST